jgi:hypothetical protein
MENRIRIKFHEHEIELAGTDKFIEKHLVEFWTRIEGPARPAASKAVQADGSKSHAVKSGKKPSPAEFVREKSPDGGTELLIVLGKYLEDYRNQAEYAKKDLNSIAREAKMKDVHSQYFNLAVKQGLMRSAGKGKYSLTLSGEDSVLAMPKAKSK